MQNIINEQLMEMLDKLESTGEFSRYRLEKLSEDPEALFNACLEWEGILGYDEDIKKYAKGLFRALPELLYDEEKMRIHLKNLRRSKKKFISSAAYSMRSNWISLINSSKRKGITWDIQLKLKKI